MKPMSGYKTMAKDHICCFHIFTAAAIVGILQCVLIVICLSTSGIVLDHWQNWKTDFQRNHDMYVAMPKPMTISSSTTQAGVPLFVTRPNTTSVYHTTVWNGYPNNEYQMAANNSWFLDVGLETFVQIHLAHHIAIYSIWLLFMIFYALAFREMRPILVLPNIIMQLIVLVIIIVLGGTLIARMVKLNRQYKNAQSLNEDMQMNDMEMRYAFHAVLLASIFVVWIIEFIFAYVGYKFYTYLREQMQNLFPEIHHIVFPHTLPRRVSSAMRGNEVNGGPEIVMTTNLV